MAQKILILFLILLENSLIAQTGTQQVEQKRIFNSQKIEENVITIDGKIDEQAWNNVDWQGNFIQYKPNPESQPTQKTEFKIVYDNNNIYIAIKAYDTEPEKIVRRMSRRDGYEGDFVEVMFDSYFDKQTSFSFAASAAGVKNDGASSGDGGNWDVTWDPIWFFKTSTFDQGWVVEMQIPLSQLRFSNIKNQIWGLQVHRRLFRNGEYSSWSLFPKNAAGWEHYYGELQGISNIQPRKQLEVTPYILGAYKRYQKDVSNPFSTGSKTWINAGIDGKLGLTNNLTLNYTINPDFGQVENDPSTVNLTAFETFLEERRPFFIEGKNITNFLITGGGGDIASDNLFYSRRIGRTPQFTPDVDNNINEYSDQPEKTKILSALKLTGKTNKGLSLGVIETLTANEYGTIKKNSVDSTILVEPLTNYFVGRLQQDFNNQNTIIGGMLTSTNRFTNTPQFNSFRSDAYSGGADFQHFWKDKTYYVSLKTVYSTVLGSAEAIKETQESAPHYFQRPDGKYLPYDITKTSMQGTGGTASIGKKSNNKLRYDFSYTWRSPSLELNDIGYLKYTDFMMISGWMSYRIAKPTTLFRDANLDFSEWHGWDFGGTNTFNGISINSYGEYQNQWHSSLGASLNGKNIANEFLRGGESFITPATFNFWGCTGTDGRKKVSVHINAYGNYGNNNSSSNTGGGILITYKPVDFLSFSINPNYSYETNDLQWVEQFNNTYIFASISRTTLSTTIRCDLNITPEFTIQYYGQPYISSGNYSKFKRITNPHASNYLDRFENIDSNLSYANNSDGGDYTYNGNTFNNPDFNFKEFRSNLVARWEFKPGSIIYLVWTQNKSAFDNYGTFDLNRDFTNIFDSAPQNVFLMKFSYRIGK